MDSVPFTVAEECSYKTKYKSQRNGCTGQIKEDLHRKLCHKTSPIITAN